MIVVIGSPAGQLVDRDVRAVGLAVDVGRAAAGGAPVQVVGRVGDDATGDAVLLDMAAAGIGHVALLRAAGQPTPVRPDSATEDERALGAALDEDATSGAEPVEPTRDDGLPIDAADLELALRYLPDYRVLVVAAPLDANGWATAGAAAGWAGAQLVAVVRAAADPHDLPADATVLERPEHDDDGTFGMMVGRYAALLDAGEDPKAAFVAASSGSGWASVSD
jgi:hypothetical protein